MSYLAKSILIRLPCDLKRSAVNDYGVQKFAVTGASQAFALPKDWAGRYVVFYTPSGSPDIEVGSAVTQGGAPTQQVDATVAATAGGGAIANPLKVGMSLPAGQQIHRMLPTWDRQENGFLIMQSSGANTTVKVELADGNQA